MLMTSTTETLRVNFKIQHWVKNSSAIFYGDLVYKFKRIVGKPNFSDQFKKIVKTLYKGWI